MDATGEFQQIVAFLLLSSIVCTCNWTGEVWPVTRNDSNRGGITNKQYTLSGKRRFNLTYHSLLVLGRTPM